MNSRNATCPRRLLQRLDTSHAPVVTGRSLAPKVKRDRGLAPGPSVEVSADARAPATTMRAQGGPSPRRPRCEPITSSINSTPASTWAKQTGVLAVRASRPVPWEKRLIPREDR